MKKVISKGNRYGRLKAIKFDYRDDGYRQYWIFKCDCGKEKSIRIDHIKNNKIKSCGCFKSEMWFKHGMTKTRIYRSWGSMISRCLNTNYPEYKYYGGRGITICNEWLDFRNFYKDMGDRPKGLTLDRIDNNGNYCKENCRWATNTEQANNTRRNHYLTFNGKTQNITQWAKELNLDRHTIYVRINCYNWSIKKALGF